MARTKVVARRTDESKLKSGKGLKKKPQQAEKSAKKVPRKSLVEKAQQKKVEVEAVKKPRKPHRFRPGTRALMDIRRYQKSTDLLIRRAPFVRFAREICNDQSQTGPLRMQAKAFEALQAAAEDFVIDMLSDANLVAVADKRRGILHRDFVVAALVDKSRRNMGLVSAFNLNRKTDKVFVEHAKTHQAVSFDAEKDKLKKEKRELVRQLKKSEAAVEATTAAAAAATALSELKEVHEESEGAAEAIEEKEPVVAAPMETDEVAAETQVEPNGDEKSAIPMDEAEAAEAPVTQPETAASQPQSQQQSENNGNTNGKSKTSGKKDKTKKAKHVNGHAPAVALATTSASLEF